MSIKPGSRAGLLWNSCGAILRISAQLAFLFAVPRVRSVFSSKSVKDVELGREAPQGAGGSWRAVTRVLRSCVGNLKDDSVTSLFPADCRVCGGPMTAWSLSPVCDACVGTVDAQAGTLCGICGEALGMESARFAAAMGASTCTMCRLAPPEFARAVAYLSYEDELREMLHLLKYGSMRRLADAPLGEWMAQAVLKLAEDAALDCLVIAVPLFPARERQRGFNQSALLADASIKRMRKLRPEWTMRAAHGAMRRVRDTEAQFGLLPGQRRKNLRGAFRVVDANAVRGREVLLIDDIMTTGATARECARVLVRAGAAKVFVATLARAQPEGVGAGSAAGVAMWDAGIPPTVLEPVAARRASF